MTGQIVYLDSSAILKRYIKEPGSEKAREIFVKTLAGELRIAYSPWNIGEVLGALDRARSLNRIGGEDHAIARRRFLSETKRMNRLNLALLVPVRTSLLSETWRLIEKYHVYEADALQIATAKYVDSTDFVTGDKSLHETATAEGITSTYLG